MQRLQQAPELKQEEEVLCLIQGFLFLTLLEERKLLLKLILWIKLKFLNLLPVPNLLKRKPLSSKAKLIDREMLLLILIVSLVTAISCIIIFYLYWQQSGIELARTMVFAVLSIDSLLYVFSCRSLHKNIWQDSIFKNKWLVLASLFGIVLTFLSVHLNILQKLLGTIDLKLIDWVIVFGTSFIVIFFIEIFKWIYNRYNKER